MRRYFMRQPPKQLEEGMPPAEPPVLPSIPATKQHSFPKPHYDEFVIHFPTKIHVTDRFESIEAVREALQEESCQAAFDTSLCSSYKCTIMPRKEAALKVHYRCKHCRAVITLHRNSVIESFVVITLNSEHHHRYWDMFAEEEAAETNQKEKLLQSRANYNLTEGSTSHRTQRPPPARADVFNRLLKEHIRPARKPSEEEFQAGNPFPITPFTNAQLRQYRDIKTILLASKCAYLEQSGGVQTDGLGSWPESRIVFQSQKMKRNYNEWGDSLCVDLVAPILDKEAARSEAIRLILFLVTGADLERLLAGVAIIGEDSVASITAALKMFVRLNLKLPESIIATYQKNMSKSLKILLEDGTFSGSHLYWPSTLIRHASAKLAGTASQKSEILSLLKQAVYCRDPQRFHQCLKKIQSDPINGNTIYDFFVAKLNKLCFIKVPANFSGLYNRSSYCETSGKVIGEMHATLADLVRRLLALPAEALSNLEGPTYTEPMEDVMADQRIRETRLQLSRQVFDRFLENYIAAVRDFGIAQTSQLGEQTVVRLQNSSQRHQVSQWKCDCYEAQKSGVPCPHLILCCYQSPSKRYIELFRRRWVKSRHTPQTTAQARN